MKTHRVLVTAGPTREWMDPVRFLSNPSSGAMGIAIAQRLKMAGADVTLVLGPTSLCPPVDMRVIRVESALDMFAAVKSKIKGADCFVATAAVGDWRFKKTSATKLKKDKSDTTTAQLVKNPDILAWVGLEKKKRRAPLLVIGFALETDKLEVNAQKKLNEKNLDLIIANDPKSFAGDAIHARWFESNGTRKDLGRLSKQALAATLASWIQETWKTKTSKV